MRRNGSNLASRRDWPGSTLPAGQIDFFSPTSFLASPWQMMRRMQEDMDRVFGQFFGSPSGIGDLPARSGQPAGPHQWAPSVDISQNDKEWCIEADLPGVKQDDIDVQIQDHYLILRAELRPVEAPQGQQAQGQSGHQPAGEKQDGQQQEQPQRQYHHRERRWEFFERVLPLAENIDEGKVSCDFQNGVLSIHLPKTAEQAPQGRRIPIGAGQSSRASAPAGSSASQSKPGEPAMAGSKGGETAR
jgi:HSP20 family protein